jgi:hypothetical protein
MVVDGNDNDSEAGTQQRIDGNSFLMVMLMSLCFYLIAIRGQ